jgi:hypothetical protein
VCFHAVDKFFEQTLETFPSVFLGVSSDTKSGPPMPCMLHPWECHKVPGICHKMPQNWHKVQIPRKNSTVFMQVKSSCHEMLGNS